MKEILYRLIYYLVPASAGIATYRFLKSRLGKNDQGPNILVLALTVLVIVAVMYLFNILFMGWFYPRFLA